MSVIIMLVPACLGLGVVAYADAPDSDSIPETDFAKFLPGLGYTLTKGLFSTQNVTPLAVGSFAAFSMYHFDDDISAHYAPFEDSKSVGWFLGGPAVLGTVAGSILVAPFTENRRFRAFAFDLTQAYVTNVAVIQMIKYSTGRMRPDQDDDLSFPSGHAADSFVLATMLDHYYGKKVGIPAYVVAAYVSYSRVVDGKHYPSDVVFGGVIGYVMARSAIRGHERMNSKLVFMPVLGRGIVGMNLMWQF